MTFLEFYNTVRESREDFYVGKILVRLVEVSDAEFLAEAVQSPTALGSKVLPFNDASPEKTKKWRATYEVNGKQVTNYLSAQNKNEAKRMLYDYLDGMGQDDVRKHVVQSSEIAPVDNWNELVKLLQYSMRYDRKNRGKDTEPFGSIDTGDFHLMLDLVRKNPQFVEKNLAALPQDLQFYFKKAYNALGRRDIDKDLAKGGSHWGNRVKDMVTNFGSSINKKLAAVKTRNSPRKPGAVEPQNPLAPQAQPPMRPELPPVVPGGDEGDYGYRPIPGRMPQRPQAPDYQSQLPFWR